MPVLEALQGTPEWHAARRGCYTASRAGAVEERTQKGKPTADYEKYLIELVSERMSGVATEHYVTDAMQWGIDHEDAAVNLYEIESGNMCHRAGFYLHDEIEFLGASPDRLVGKDGLAEIKCPTTKTFVTWLMNDVVPEEYRPQMRVQLLVTGRKWCDFVAYDPRVQRGPQLFIKRYTPTKEEMDLTRERAVEFLTAVDNVFTRITQGGKS